MAIIGYQTAATGGEYSNHATLRAARAELFRLVQAGHKLVAVYSRLSEGGIGKIFAETKAHWEMYPTKKLPLHVRSVEAELAKRRAHARAA